MSRVWFTDRDLGKQFPALLAAAGLTVERHGDLFAPDGSDEQWLEHCGTKGRIALSHNRRIRHVPNELAAVVRFDVSLIILMGQATTSELAHNFMLSCANRAPIASMRRTVMQNRGVPMSLKSTRQRVSRRDDPVRWAAGSNSAT